MGRSRRRGTHKRVRHSQADPKQIALGSAPNFIRSEWDKKKTALQNYESLGLCCFVNKGLGSRAQSRSINRWTAERSGSSLVEDFVTDEQSLIDEARGLLSKPADQEGAKPSVLDQLQADSHPGTRGVFSSEGLLLAKRLVDAHGDDVKVGFGVFTSRKCFWTGS